MANVGDLGRPIPFLTGQSGTDDRYLTLPIFMGEVMAAFDFAVKMKALVRNQTLGKGTPKAVFYKTWKAVAYYHARGVEMLGENIDTTKIEISVDNPLVSPFALYDLDEMLANFEVRSEFAKQTGIALAKVFDENISRSIVLAARTAADGPFPAGNVITDSTLTNTGTVDGLAWLDAVRKAKLVMQTDPQNVPEELTINAMVNPTVFDAVLNSRLPNGQYVFGDSVRMAASVNEITWQGVHIMSNQNLPTTNETSDTTVYSKYRANYSTTTGIAWVEPAVAAAIMMDIQFESTRDTRRQEDFQVAKMLAGHGTLRPEGALEFKTS